MLNCFPDFRGKTSCAASISELCPRQGKENFNILLFFFWQCLKINDNPRAYPSSLLAIKFLLLSVSKMTEKDFWTKYWRAEYLHSTKNIVAAAAEAAEDEELAVFLKQDDILASEARRKVLYLRRVKFKY